MANIVKDNIGNIKEWLSQDLALEDIANKLGVSLPTLKKHIKTSGYDLEELKNGKKSLSKNVVDAMYLCACGYSRKVKRYEKLKRVQYEDGKKSLEYEEMAEYEVEEYIKPSVTAQMFLLKNWDNYMSEPSTIEIRKKELELKEKQSW